MASRQTPDSASRNKEFSSLDLHICDEDDKVAILCVVIKVIVGMCID